MDQRLRRLLFNRKGRVRALIEDLGTIEAGEIADNSIEGKHIKNNAVTTAKIAEKAITTARLDDEAVTLPKIKLQVVTVQVSGTDISGTADIQDGNSQILGAFQSAVSGGAGAIPAKSVSINSQEKKVTVTLGEAPGNGKSVTYTVILLRSA